jgi:CO/xanthine dehydrogenase FAD-binding subunit
VKPAAFDYFDPRTQEETIALLDEHGDSAKILAGGQSLVPMLNLRLLRPSCLVDINRVEGMAFIEERQGELVIGARTRQRAIEKSDLVRARCPLLHEAMPFIAHFQIRNRGTIGGSLSHADPAAELPTIVTALEGRLVLHSARGERILNADAFFTGFLTTALQPDELLTEIRVSAQPEGSGWAFSEVSRRHGDFALAAAATCITLDRDGRCLSAKLVLAGVHGVPFRNPEAEKALIGTRLSREGVRHACELLVSRLTPQSDLHASSEYRKHAARVLAERTLARAVTTASRDLRGAR